MTQRRKEIRRHLKMAGPWYQRFMRQDVGWAVFYVLIFALVAGSLSIYARTRLPYYLGQQLHQPVIARADFGVVNDQKTQELREEAVERAASVYRPNQTYMQDLEARLVGLGKVIADTNVKFSEISPEIIDQFQLKESALATLRQSLLPKSGARKQAGQDQQTAFAKIWDARIRTFLDVFFTLAILETDRYQIEVRARQLLIQMAQHRVPRSFTELYDIQDNQHKLAKSTLSQVISQYAASFEVAKPLVTSMVLRDLRPTVLYDQALSQQEKNQAAVAIAPHQENYLAGEIIIQSRVWQNQDQFGTQSEPSEINVEVGSYTFKRLDQHDMKLLSAEQQAYELKLGNFSRWLHNLGLLGIFLVTGVCLWTYVWIYCPKITRNPLRGMVLSILVLGGLAFAVMAEDMMPQVQVTHLILPVLFVSGILAIAYERRLALTVGAVLTLVLGISLQLPPVILPVLIAGLAILISQMYEISHRSTLVKAGFLSGLGMAVCTILTQMVLNPTIISLDMQVMPQEIWWGALMAFGTGLFVGIFIHGLLPWIEMVFTLTTSMTLRELNDASHPLLRKMAQDAPGTYQHSLRIADMAEEAARTIGANPLLSRVGAMYHDIGKTHKPHYFIENQGGGQNQHEYLSPAMSLLIILGHVKDGVEMAKEYHLPREVIHFIESHHGTTLVEYFYHAAIKQSSDPKRAPEEYEFRYPGPKPRTREAAIMMIADASESASRCLENPTPKRIEHLVHDVAMRRLLDGQFDECQLTLKELKQIEATITRVLCAANHGRIQYPGQATGQAGQTNEAQAASDADKKPKLVTDDDQAQASTMGTKSAAS